MSVFARLAPLVGFSLQGGGRMIRTPDQRVRVFVSSTLQELAAERAAVRESISQLRLTPVMFEIGARAHPPQDLYRSYLGQSDVFVGIYWQSYGWMAPGAAVSGVEDEYELAGDRPRLIYVREPAPEREPGLEDLLERIREDARASYKEFDTAESLAELLLDDLALLMSERFQASPEEGRLSSGTLTFLFADMERSTQLLEELGEEYSDLVSTYHGFVNAAASSRGGRVESRAGDGVFCVFSDAVEAVEASVELQRSLAGHQWPRGVDVRARIGIHTGSARELPEGYVGIDVHRAARVGEAAQGGQVILSSTTASLVGDHASRRGWRLATLGDFDMRGLTHPERLSHLIVPDLEVSARPPRARKVGASPAPAALTSFVGRGAELEELQSLLARTDVRLVTLTGSGGIGKTRMAMEVAHTVGDLLEDGVEWVALDTVTEPELVPDTIAASLGLMDSGRQSIMDTVAEYLSDKEMLIVLDNFEHVLDAAPVVTTLLERAPRATVLVTSRSPLRLRGEHELPVGVLAYPGDSAIGDETVYPAVELFIARAKAANPHLNVDPASLESIAALTAQLDGLPLAIELAAARTRYLDPQMLASRMTSLLDLLSRGAQDSPERHRTIRETIRWSEHLLSDDARRLLRRLAVFRTNPTFESVIAVANWDGAISGDPLAELEGLADLGLIGIESTHDRPEPEVSMLRVVREYAMEELAAKAELEQTRQAHAAYYLKVVEDAAPYIWTPQRGSWIAHLERSQGEIAAAFVTLSSGQDTSGAWRLAAAIGPFIALRGPYGQALRLIAEAGISATAELPVGVSEFIAGVALQSVGVASFLTGDFSASLPPLHRSVELLTASGDGRELARSQAYLGLAGISLGDPAAMADLASARTAGEELDDLPAFAIASAFSGEVASALGDFEGAREFVRFAEERCRAADDRWLLGITLIVSTIVAIVTDHVDDAIAIAEEAHEALAAEQPGVAGWPLVLMAYGRLLRGDLDVSRKNFQEAIEVGRRAGDKTIVLAGLIGLGGVTAAEGDADRGARLVGAADTIRTALGYQMWSATLHMYEEVQDLISERGDPTVVEQARREGSRLSYEEALALAASD
jgi:predicted ATPase/class 3 adenylate cyclase